MKDKRKAWQTGKWAHFLLSFVPRRDQVKTKQTRKENIYSQPITV